MVKVYPIFQNRCENCKQKTTWHCVGCKRWLCMEHNIVENNHDKLEKLEGLYSHEVCGKALHFQKVCYHVVHEDTWCQLANEKRSENNACPNVTP